MFGTRIPIGLVVRLTLLCLLCLVSLPGAASATTVSVDNGTLRVSGGPGEWNAITVAPEGLPGCVAVLAVTDGGRRRRARGRRAGRVECDHGGARGAAWLCPGARRDRWRSSAHPWARLLALADARSRDVQLGGYRPDRDGSGRRR